MMAATSQFVPFGLDMGHLSAHHFFGLSLPIQALWFSYLFSLFLTADVTWWGIFNLFFKVFSIVYSYFSSGLSQKKSQVLFWKSQPVCKGEDKRSDCFCANSLSSSFLLCRPHKLHASVDRQALLHQPEESLDSYSTNDANTHRGTWFPNRTWSSRLPWVQPDAVGAHTQVPTITWYHCGTTCTHKT